MIIGCDCDEVLANLMDEWLARYNADFNDNLTKDKILDWAIEQYVKPEARQLTTVNGFQLPKIFKYLQDPDLYTNIKVVDGAKAGLEFLRARGHDVIIVSSCVINGADQKMNWLVNHGLVKPVRGDTLKDFIGASDKSYVRVNCLIDDAAKNVKNVDGIRVLFDAPWNAETPDEYYDILMLGWGNIEETTDMIEYLWSEYSMRAYDGY